jgi:hypothetical protein
MHLNYYVFAPCEVAASGAIFVVLLIIISKNCKAQYSLNEKEPARPVRDLIFQQKRDY